MILDKGYCSVYSSDNIADAGNMPVDGYTLMYQSWYGELDFETAPIKTSEAQEDVEISARVRIVQNRGICNHDIVVLADTLTPSSDAIQYEIKRAYHGTDDDSGELITDLTLKKVVQQYELN